MPKKNNQTNSIDAIVDSKLLDLESRIGKKIEVEINKEEKLLETVFRNLIRYENGAQNDVLSQKFDNLERRFDKLENKFEDVINRVYQNHPTRDEVDEKIEKLTNKVKVIDKRTLLN